MGAIASFRRASATAALTLACLGFSRVAVAGDIVCDHWLVQEGDWGYKQRSSDRCEGEYYYVAANPGYSSVLQPVSLVLRFGEVDPQREGKIRVAWNGSLPAKTVKVTATSLRPEHYYRMDALVDSSTSYQWATTFTSHEQLRRHELAVLAQRSDGVFLPVTVGSVQASVSKLQPFVIIKSTKPLKDLTYSIRRIDTRATRGKGGGPPKDVPVTGEYITIPLDLPREGDYRLTISAHLENGKLVGLPLTFHYAQ